MSQEACLGPFTLRTRVLPHTLLPQDALACWEVSILPPAFEKRQGERQSQQTAELPELVLEQKDHRHGCFQGLSVHLLHWWEKKGTGTWQRPEGMMWPWFTLPAALVHWNQASECSQPQVWGKRAGILPR